MSLSSWHNQFTYIYKTINITNYQDTIIKEHTISSEKKEKLNQESKERLSIWKLHFILFIFCEFKQN